MHPHMDGILRMVRPVPSALDALAGVARDGAGAGIERSLAAARELLGMRLAYLTEAGEEAFRFHALDGDAAPFGGPAAGVHVPRADTLCDRMLRGRIVGPVPDVARAPAAQGAAGSPGVAAYVGVPVRLPDGTVYGTLCCVSDEPVPALSDRDTRLLEVFARLIGDQIARERHQRRSLRLEGEATAGQALLAALKARERYTAEHSEAVVELSTAVAHALGLADEDVVQVAQVALLHDVGKLGVPEAILQKPGALSDAEWRIVRAHPAIGERVVASIPSLAHLAPAVRAEHERWDGKGYPDGLAGAEIPLASRICLACDAWHAMTSDRPYRAALPADAARAELLGGAGSQFCPRDGRRAAVRARRPPGGRPRAARAREHRPHRPARIRAARADRRGRRRGGGAPPRGRARGRGRGDPPRGRRLVGLDQPLGARARARADAHQRRRARPRRGALPDRRDLRAGRLPARRAAAARRRVLRRLARRRRASGPPTASCSTRSTRAPTSASR